MIVSIYYSKSLEQKLAFDFIKSVINLALVLPFSISLSSSVPERDSPTIS